MSYPIIAYKTFQRLKESRAFRKISDYTSSKLSKIVDPISRARFVYKQVNKYNEEVLKDKVVQKHLSCKIGCTACCHSQVSATYEESVLLADLVDKGTEINMQRLYTQQKVGNSVSDWYKLSYEERACVFLGEEGQCTVYEDRPSVCRTNFVISDPVLCETRDGVEKPIRLLNTQKSDMVVYAAYRETKEAGILANLLWKNLDLLNKTPLSILRSVDNNDKAI